MSGPSWCRTCDILKTERNISKNSRFIDLAVILIFLLKFTLTLYTNFHDVDGLLNDNYLGHNMEEYVELVHYADYYVQAY